MVMKPFLIVSDIHLGAVPRSTERSFRDFLAHVRENASGLLVNGDLFDFWFEYRTVVAREHFRVLASLAELVESGLPVSFVGGNHDAWGGSFLRDEVGMKVIDGPVEMDLGGRRALVAHGDGLGKGDLGYRALRTLIRSRLTVHAFRMLHPDWGSRIADVVSSTGGKTGDAYAADRGRGEFLRRWAAEQLREKPEIELVVAGHCHVPTVEEVFPGRVYANAGDCLNHFSYLELPAGGGAPRLCRWPGPS
jgi:UDP-2,3-diacylglucosamine hydrolase